MISVIVPVYNVEKYLERCIRSILKQTYTDFELLIVNDGSTDGSGEKCDELALEDERVRVFHKKNGGLSDARNWGIKEAKGEYLAFIDSDDFIHPQMLQVLYNNLIHYKADISVCSYWWQKEGEAVKEEDCGDEPRVFEGKEIIQQLFVNKPETGVAWNKLYRAEMFREIQYPKGKFHEDEFVIHRLLYLCKRIVYSKRKLYYYMKHEDSITGKLNAQRVMDTLESLEDRVNFFDSIGLEQESMLEYKHWLREVRGKYQQCGIEKFPGYEEVQKWLRMVLRDRLTELKGKKIINEVEGIQYRIWTFNPCIGDMAEAFINTIVITKARCKKVGKCLMRR